MDGEAKDEVQPVKPEKKPRAKKSVPFDPDEPHATIHGGVTKARYQQDGRYYDNQFNPCEF